MLSVIALHLFLVAHSPKITYQPYGQKMIQDMVQSSAMFKIPLEDIMVLSYKEAKFKRKSRYHNDNGTIDYGAMSLNSAYILEFYADLKHEFGAILTENEIYNDNIVLGAYRYHQIIARFPDRSMAFKVYNGGTGALRTGVSDDYSADMLRLTSTQVFWVEVYPRFLKTVFLVNGHIPTDKDLMDFPVMRYNLTN